MRVTLNKHVFNLFKQIVKIQVGKQITNHIKNVEIHITQKTKKQNTKRENLRKA